MKWRLGQVESESSETRDAASYESVALEYYDRAAHPTCADFRTASRNFLTRFFARVRLEGRVADVGCGKSLIAEFIDQNLVLVDSSAKMLSQNEGANEKRLVDIESQDFGVSEFDWIFAILADPFNSKNAWKNISLALKEQGRCVFVVPSYRWVSNFRENHNDERSGFARFVRRDGSFVYLPSKVLPYPEQVSLISSVGLVVTDFVQETVGAIPTVTSPKISEFLGEEDPVLDIYEVMKS